MSSIFYKKLLRDEKFILYLSEVTDDVFEILFGNKKVMDNKKMPI